MDHCSYEAVSFTNNNLYDDLSNVFSSVIKMRSISKRQKRDSFFDEISIDEKLSFYYNLNKHYISYYVLDQDYYKDSWSVKFGFFTGLRLSTEHITNVYENILFPICKYYKVSVLIQSHSRS